MHYNSLDNRTLAFRRKVAVVKIADKLTVVLHRHVFTVYFLNIIRKNWKGKDRILTVNYFLTEFDLAMRFHNIKR